MSAKDLFKKGDKTVQILKQIFEKKGVPVEDIGREHTIKNKEISKKLSFDSSLTACFVRFQPDLIVYTDKPTLVEVKTGKTITKEAYDHYLKLELLGLNVLIFFYLLEEWYFSKPSEIEFFSYPSKNNFMFHSKINLNIPVQGHWIYPRRMNQEELKKYKAFFKCSGACFANIDFKRLKKFK